jgi:hypothetical protein
MITLIELRIKETGTLMWRSRRRGRRSEIIGTADVQLPKTITSMKQFFADFRSTILMRLAGCMSYLQQPALSTVGIRSIMKAGQHHLDIDAAMEPRGQSLAHTLICPEYGVTVVAGSSRFVGACGVKASVLVQS